MRYNTSVVLFIALLTMFLPVRNAHAYIDLGSGSFIFQILIASLLGILFTIKSYWGSIKNFFGKLLDPQNKR